jgi:hypothetical protein
MSEWAYGTILRRTRGMSGWDGVRAMVVADNGTLVRMTTLRDDDGVFSSIAHGFYDFGKVWTYRMDVRRAWEPVDAED